MAFYVGQKVVALATWDRTAFVSAPPVKGTIYTIREIRMFDQETTLRFHELKNPERQWSNAFGEAAFGAQYFRPVVEDTDKLAWARKLVEPGADKRPLVREPEHV